MCILYRATNQVNNKVYVGFTTSTLANRRVQHLRDAKHKRRTGKRMSKFHTALLAGQEKFIWEVIYESWDNDFCLNVAENMLIECFDSIRNGYNTIPGGSSRSALTGPKNGMYGKTHTLDTRKKISEQLKGRYKGISHKDRFGNRADDINIQRSKSVRAHRAANPNFSAGANNGRYDSTVYSFQNSSNATVFTGTRFDFIQMHPDLHRSGVCELINKNPRRPHYKQWRLVGDFIALAN